MSTLLHVLFWRHADAEESAPGGDDLRRSLTREGRRDASGYAIRMTGRYLPARPGQEDFTQIVRAQRSGDCTPR